MKHLIFIYFLLPSIIFAQGQFIPATIVYTDGLEEKTEINFPIQNNQKRILTRKSKGEKRKNIDISDVVRFRIDINNAQFQFHIDKYEYHVKDEKTKTTKNDVIFLIIDECENMSYYKKADVYKFNLKENEMVCIAKSHHRSDIPQFSFYMHRDGEYPFSIPLYPGGLAIGYKKVVKNAQLYYFKDDSRMLNYINSKEKAYPQDIYEEYCNKKLD